MKPGAQMNEITKTTKEEIKALKCEDVVVVWGGANDISRNNMKEALKYVYTRNLWMKTKDWILC